MRFLLFRTAERLPKSRDLYSYNMAKLIAMAIQKRIHDNFQNLTGNDGIK